MRMTLSIMVLIFTDHGTKIIFLVEVVGHGIWVAVLAAWVVVGVQMALKVHLIHARWVVGLKPQNGITAISPIDPTINLLLPAIF